jgi:hypothetical protein
MPGLEDMFGGGQPPMGGGTPPGGPGGMPGMPPGDPMAQMAMKGLEQASPSKALQKVDEALTLAYKLVESVLPQISQLNPKVSKDLHQVAQRIQSIKLDVKKEMPPSPPPEMMGLSGGAGPMGAPPPGMGGGNGGGPFGV